MKRIMNARTVRTSLARANKRLAEIEVEMAELQVEKDRIGHLRAALDRQLPMPAVLELQPHLASAGLGPEPAAAAGTIVESGDCFWATGPHQHGMKWNEVTCLAPEEQRREP